MNIIEEAFAGGGHVVLLGAGASIAATIKDPELFGHKLPSMNDLSKVIPMDDLINQLPKKVLANNFEQLYSNVYAENSTNPVLNEINERIYKYFSKLRLAMKPTIYDILVMSLRPKDVIATFNWDPFLQEAWWRNGMHGAKPRLCFLHGNVAVGYDAKNSRMGPVNTRSKITGELFKPTPLLYPTGQKDYDSDPFIHTEWEDLRSQLTSKCTKRVTIFGYSAPKSDFAAMKLLKEAWGGSEKRNMEQFELIDVRPENEVTASWDEFIHTHHYDYCTDFFQSSIAQYPRRTSESYFFRYLPTTIEEAFHAANPVPKNFETFDEMWKWFQPLIDVEERENANG